MQSCNLNEQVQPRSAIQHNSLPATSMPAALLLLLPARLLLLLLQCCQDLVHPHLHDRLARLGALEEVVLLVAALLLWGEREGESGVKVCGWSVCVGGRAAAQAVAMRGRGVNHTSGCAHRDDMCI